MDLSSMKLRWGVSRSHSGRNEMTVLITYWLGMLKTVAAQFFWNLLLRTDWLHISHLKYSVNGETCKVHNLLWLFEVSHC